MITVSEDEGIKSFVRDGVLMLQTKNDGQVLNTCFSDASINDVPSWFPCEAAVESFLERR